MINLWNKKIDFNQTSSGYTIDNRSSIFEEKVLKTHDIHFKNQTCLNGVTYSYIKDLDNIYEKTLLIGNGNAINNMYTEYNMIEKYMKNHHNIDVAFGEEIDLSKNYFKLDNIELKENHLVLLFNQIDKVNNDIYIIKNNKLEKTNILSTREKANKAKFHIKLGTYKERVCYLLNESINFPITNEKKDFEINDMYLLKNEIQYNINAVDPKIIFTNYDVARHLQDNSINFNSITFDIPTNIIIITLSFSVSETFDLVLKEGYNYNATIYWGDGTSSAITSDLTSSSSSSSLQKNFNAGEYTLIIDGDFPGLYFQNDLHITDVVEWGNKDNLEYINFKNSTLKNISGTKGKLKNVSSFHESFYGTLISEIPNDLFYDNHIADFESTFENCYNLTTINDIFYDNTGVTAFNSTFKSCKIINISENLFKNNTEVLSFTSTFEHNNISIIPKELFKYNTKVQSFTSTFKTNNIINIPYQLFNTNIDVVSFDYTFEGNLIETVLDYFKTNTSVTSFHSSFKSNNIKIISENIFKNNRSVTTFESVFEYNYIGAIYSGLFIANRATISFKSTFKDNIIVHIPKKLFINNILVNNFDKTFKNNTELIYFEGISLIDNENTGITFVEMFENCYKLKIYSDFTFNQTIWEDSETTFTFTNCFDGCYNIQGEAQILWDINSSTGVDCFRTCTQLNNYYTQIPITWGGHFQ